jgi:hypothetical protein
MSDTEKCPTNWTSENGGAWLGCPHCEPDLGQIYLPKHVRGDLSAVMMFNAAPTVAEPGLYIADFNQHGAASVRATNGKMLGIKPGEFQWTRPVPPYDRWCKGKGGLHQ